MPGREYQAGSASYRYSINGQEKDAELNKNITSAEFWEYDSRLGRRWNVDPVLKESESPYVCFSNGPVYLIDINGADTFPSNGSGNNNDRRLGSIAGGIAPASSIATIGAAYNKDNNYAYVSQFKKIEYNGTLSDNPIDNGSKVVGNFFIGLGNIGLEFWNSGVKTVQTIKEGTYWESLYGEMLGTFNSASEYMGNSLRYTLNTPIKQQFIDAGKTLNDPKTLETALTIYITGKYSGGFGSTENLFYKAPILNKGTTIIGEGMERVSVAATKIPGARILNDMPIFSGTKWQVTSQMMQYNRKWILSELRYGRPILDIGKDPLRSTPSIFYQMEKHMVKNYNILHFR